LNERRTARRSREKRRKKEEKDVFVWGTPRAYERKRKEREKNEGRNASLSSQVRGKKKKEHRLVSLEEKVKKREESAMFLYPFSAACPYDRGKGGKKKGPPCYREKEKGEREKEGAADVLLVLP